MTAEGVHIFHATDLTVGEPRREVTEQDMRQQWFSRNQVERMLRDGVITDAPSAAAILLLTLH
jgi:hypothetical protein